MKRSPRELLFLVVGLLLIAAPFSFGLLRGLKTGTDWRYLWVAFAAFLGSSTIIMVGRSRNKAAALSVGIALIALIAGTLAAVLAAKFLADTQSVAAWIVAFAFAFCTTVGTILYIIAKARSS